MTCLANSELVAQIGFAANGQTVMTTTKQYDHLNRLTNIQSAVGSSVVAASAYQYNLANQRTALTNADNSYWIYTYDDLGQVTSGRKYWANGTPVAGQQFDYTFDDIGNRKTAASGGNQFGSGLRQQTYTANNLNQYTSRTVPPYVDVLGTAASNATVTVWGDKVQPVVPTDPTNWVRTLRQGDYWRAEAPVNNSTGAVWLTLTNIAVLNDGTNADIMSSVTGRVLVAKSPESFTYDFDGNLTSDGLWTNIWNGENRHSVIESRPSVPAAARFREQWTFLPDGRWIERIVSTNNGSAYYPAYTNRYVWDGQVLLAVLDHTNGLEMSFLRGLDLSGSLQGAGGVGGLLAVTFKTGGTHFAAYDGNGNVAALVSAADGTTSAQYEYGPFGEALRQTGSMAKLNPIRFSTQFADDVTDVLKYLYRDFNPTTGRWLSRDPMEEKGGRNLYCFVANCPVNRVDALGLYEWGAWWDGFSGSLSGSWTSMGDALFDGLAGNSAVSSYYGVSVTAPDDMFENSAWGQSEAIGGATEVATKGCIGTAVIATVAVSYVGAAEFVAGYGGHGAVNMGIHATFRSNQRVVSTWAIRGALRWGARVANTGGTSSTFVRFTTTARYVIPVAASTGGRYLHGLPPEVKNYMLSVVRNIWTGRIVTVWIE